MSVSNLMAGVWKSAYRSSSPNVSSMVPQRLAKGPRFKPGSPGVYALKGSAATR